MPNVWHVLTCSQFQDVTLPCVFESFCAPLNRSQLEALPTSTLCFTSSLDLPSAPLITAQLVRTR